MRTVKRPEVRKREILEGSLDVFLRNGYEKTTIGEISKELGISQGLCYRYFASKEEIYDAVIDTYAAYIAEENLRYRPKTLHIWQWIDQIPQMFTHMEKTEKEHLRLYALLHSPQNGRMHRELCMKVGERLIPVVTQVLEQAKELGEIEIDDCRGTAAFGIYGEIGLINLAGMDAAEAVKKNWQRLLGLQ